MSEINYKLEELRGLFAIGAVASLAAFKSEIEASPSGIVLVFLALFWGMYVFFMAVGISRIINALCYITNLDTTPDLGSR